MRAFVTGAAGFIGSHLCERLLSTGWDVVGIDNFDPYYDRQLKESYLQPSRANERFAFVEEDLRNLDAVRAIWTTHCQDVDAVVHLAARAGVRPSIQDPIACEQANVYATMNLLELSSQAQRRPRFVFASSSSVYGNNPKVPFSEDDSVDRPISPYAATKKACELLCFTYHHLYDLPMTALRFFTVYGPRQRPDLAIHLFTANILRDKPIKMFGDGSSSRDYTYIDDIINGVTAAIDRCQGYEIINLGSKSPITLKEMIETIESGLGKKAVIEQLDMQPGDVNRTFADVTKAKRLLDYEPKTDFAEGVRREIEWCRSIYG